MPEKKWSEKSVTLWEFTYSIYSILSKPNLPVFQLKSEQQ